MSFILDALRKSEHERQRQSGPALAEVPIAMPKSRSNVWAPFAIALLLINLVVIGVLLIRKAVREPVAPPPAAVIAHAAPSARPTPTPGNQAGATAIVETPADAPAAPPAMLQPALPPAQEGQARNPLAAEAIDGSPTLDPQMAERAAAPPEGPPAVTRTPGSRGSVVYESLPESATLGGRQTQLSASAGRTTAGSGSGSGIPSADDLVASGAVPSLNMDLHVYSLAPAERLVFINSRKYREGDTLQEGPVVRQITPAGAIIEFNGRSYLLTHN